MLEPVVIEVDRQMSCEERDRVHDEAAIAWPDRKVVVMGPGMRVSRDEQLDRIETKLDRLLEALAEDEDDGPTHDLEGNLLPKARDTSDIL